jgi:hypothetical protein
MALKGFNLKGLQEIMRIKEEVNEPGKFGGIPKHLSTVIETELVSKSFPLGAGGKIKLIVYMRRCVEDNLTPVRLKPDLVSGDTTRHKNGIIGDILDENRVKALLARIDSEPYTAMIYPLRFADKVEVTLHSVTICREQLRDVFNQRFPVENIIQIVRTCTRSNTVPKLVGSITLKRLFGAGEY